MPSVIDGYKQSNDGFYFKNWPQLRTGFLGVSSIADLDNDGYPELLGINKAGIEVMNLANPDELRSGYIIMEGSWRIKYGDLLSKNLNSICLLEFFI